MKLAALANQLLTWNRSTKFVTERCRNQVQFQPPPHIILVRIVKKLLLAICRSDLVTTYRHITRSSIPDARLEFRHSGDKSAMSVRCCKHVSRMKAQGVLSPVLHPIIPCQDRRANR